jgi:integrase
VNRPAGEITSKIIHLEVETRDAMSDVDDRMRHAKINTTMEIYTHARMEKKRQAQSKVVDVLFGRERKMA